MIDYISEHTLNYSLSKHCIIAIIYMKDTEITQRKIRVLTIDDQKIRALDTDKKAIRTFKKDNILSAMRLKTTKEKGDE